MEFVTKDKTFDLEIGLRDKLKPDWREIFKPARNYPIIPNLYIALPFVTKAEQELENHGISLVGKDILEVGCCYGERSFLMAKYEGTKVHGIDVDDYLVNQSVDLNVWNPKDIEYIHNKVDGIHLELSKSIPMSIVNKVTFETSSIVDYVTNNPHDIIISWDTLEHIIDLPLAFNQMANALKKGGIAYHEYNSFFSLTGGHSLCTLDFLYGHCRLSKEDFERYIRELRPTEEKTALNFYYKCLNRVTKKDILELSEKNGFEILEFKYENPYSNEYELREVIKVLERDILPDVVKIYPNCGMEDLLHASVHIILRKK